MFLIILLKCNLPQNYHSTVHYQAVYVFKMANKNTHTIQLLLMDIDWTRICATAWSHCISTLCTIYLNISSSVRRGSTDTK